MEPSSASPVALRLGAFAAVIGGLLLVPGAVWISISPSEGTVSGLLGFVGLLGTALATLSVLGLYPLLTKGDETPVTVWPSLGAAVVLLSLAALVFVSLQTSPEDGQSRLQLAASILAWWIMPVGILLFAFALVRADILFGRALLLFFVALVESPLISNIAVRLSDSDWSTLLFGLPAGLPGTQTGLLGAAVWAVFGYSLLLLSREEDRHSEDEYQSTVLRRL